MKALKGILVVLAVVTLSSCATTRYSSGVTPEQVGTMALLEPVSYMSYIQSTREEVFDPETSAQSASMVKDLVMQNFPEIKTVLPLDDYWDRDRLESEIKSLYVVDAKHLAQSWVPSSILRFLKDQGCRYGVAVFATGFTRDDKEYKREAVFGALIGVLTAIISFGMYTYVPMPFEFSNSLYMVVVDAEEDSIVFYDRAVTEEYHPLDAKKLNRRIALFRKHFK
jgi:hypothetical protein